MSLPDGCPCCGRKRNKSDAIWLGHIGVCLKAERMRDQDMEV